MSDKDSLAIQRAVLMGIKQDYDWELAPVLAEAKEMIRKGNEMLVDIEAKIGHNKFDTKNSTTKYRNSKRIRAKAAKGNIMDTLCNLISMILLTLYIGVIVAPDQVGAQFAKITAAYVIEVNQDGTIQATPDSE